MQVSVDLDFEELVKIVKSLPSVKLKQLKAEINKQTQADKSGIDLEQLLLSGPTATEKQLKTIAKNRKAINEWRIKH
jgi:hypothetical protein